MKRREREDQSGSLKLSRLIIPMIIGVSAVVYLFIAQFDRDEFSALQWTSTTVFWLFMAVIAESIRHMGYAWRIRHLSDQFFSWKKSIELIFIWEFSSAVSPTSLGGSAVAFFVLSKEKLKTAKTATIVLYTVVLDSAFLLITLPVFFLLFGPAVLRPGGDPGGWMVYFVTIYFLMLAYSSVFFYGIFIDPSKMKAALRGVTALPLLKRFREKAMILGDDLIITSAELRQKPLSYHFQAFLATAFSWSFRFLLLNFIMLAILPDISKSFWDQFQLYARIETMFFVIAFSPTPGGAGLIELLFNGFMSDYVSNTTSTTIISTIWRFLSYYIYLIVGAMIIPGWIRKIWRKK
jgi:glycosyltransferase 2 family protein